MNVRLDWMSKSTKMLLNPNLDGWLMCLLIVWLPLCYVPVERQKDHLPIAYKTDLGGVGKRAYTQAMVNGSLQCLTANPVCPD